MYHGSRNLVWESPQPSYRLLKKTPSVLEEGRYMPHFSVLFVACLLCVYTMIISVRVPFLTPCDIEF